MAKKRTKIPSIGTIDTPRKNRKLSRSSSLSWYDCDIILVIYNSTTTPNVPKKITPDDIHISENYKQY